MKMKSIDLSILICAYNEEKTIQALRDGITNVLANTSKSYEVIFIDDGSTDGTSQEIKKLCQQDAHVKHIKLRRNFGKSLALAVGFKNANGDVVITMDADLQDQPEEIPQFLTKIEEGWDVVSGWKKLRKDPIEKRWPSKIFNTIVSKISGVVIHDFNCGFKAYRREVIGTIQLYGEFHRYIPMLASSYGFKICEIPIAHQARHCGKSKFGKERYLAGFFDLFSVIFVTGYLRKPLHFIGRISLASLAMGMLLLTYVFVLKFFLGQLGNRPAFFISIFLLGFSVQIFIFGLMADLLSFVNQKDSFNPEDFICEPHG